jgi:hypothetical protein
MKEGEGKVEVGLGWVCHGDEQKNIVRHSTHVTSSITKSFKAFGLSLF